MFKWAQEAEQPLRIYAVGLLAGAMENQDIAANYREENSVLVSRSFMRQLNCVKQSQIRLELSVHERWAGEQASKQNSRQGLFLLSYEGEKCPSIHTLASVMHMNSTVCTSASK